MTVTINGVEFKDPRGFVIEFDGDGELPDGVRINCDKGEVFIGSDTTRGLTIDNGTKPLPPAKFNGYTIAGDVAPPFKWPGIRLRGPSTLELIDHASVVDPGRTVGDVIRAAHKPRGGPTIGTDFDPAPASIMDDLEALDAETDNHK